MNGRSVPARPAAAPGAVVQPPEQILYARWLDIGTRVGLTALVLLFLVYVSGAATATVPPEQLPSLWTLPVADYLRATGFPSGWAWLGQIGRADVMNLIGIVILAGCSVLCLVALLPGYARRGERVYVAVCLVEIAVIVLAASGLLGGGH